MTVQIIRGPSSNDPYVPVKVAAVTAIIPNLVASCTLSRPCTMRKPCDRHKRIWVSTYGPECESHPAIIKSCKRELDEEVENTPEAKKKARIETFANSLPPRCSNSDRCWMATRAQVCSHHFRSWRAKFGDNWSQSVCFNNWQLDEEEQDVVVGVGGASSSQAAGFLFGGSTAMTALEDWAQACEDRDAAENAELVLKRSSIVDVAGLR